MRDWTRSMSPSFFSVCFCVTSDMYRFETGPSFQGTKQFPHINCFEPHPSNVPSLSERWRPRGCSSSHHGAAEGFDLSDRKQEAQGIVPLELCTDAQICLSRSGSRRRIPQDTPVGRALHTPASGTRRSIAVGTDGPLLVWQEWCRQTYPHHPVGSGREYDQTTTAVVRRRWSSRSMPLGCKAGQHKFSSCFQNSHTCYSLQKLQDPSVGGPLEFNSFDPNIGLASVHKALRCTWTRSLYNQKCFGAPKSTTSCGSMQKAHADNEHAVLLCQAIPMYLRKQWMTSNPCKTCHVVIFHPRDDKAAKKNSGDICVDSQGCRLPQQCQLLPVVARTSQSNDCKKDPFEVAADGYFLQVRDQDLTSVQNTLCKKLVCHSCLHSSFLYGSGKPALINSTASVANVAPRPPKQYMNNSGIKFCRLHAGHCWLGQVHLKRPIIWSFAWIFFLA